MAGSAFKDAEIIQKLKPFVPVLVDGDTEKAVVQQFNVRGYPNVRFVTAYDEKVHGELTGAVPVATFARKVDGALQSIGPIRLSKAYKKLLKAQHKLEKALAEEDPKDALKAIAEIEKLEHPGPELDAALAAKETLSTQAQAELEQAKRLLESDPKKGQSALKKIKSTYKGLDVADQAAELLKKK